MAKWNGKRRRPGNRKAIRPKRTEQETDRQRRIRKIEKEQLEKLDQLDREMRLNRQ